MVILSSVGSTILSCTSRPGPCRILVTGYELPDIGIAHYDSDEDYDDDMVAAWSVDRLGRSLIDLDFLRELHAKSVDLFLHQQGLDTSTPSGRAMFQICRVRAVDDPRAGHGRSDPGQG
jgi:hypothetical protein